MCIVRNSISVVISFITFLIQAISRYEHLDRLICLRTIERASNK